LSSFLKCNLYTEGYPTIIEDPEAKGKPGKPQGQPSQSGITFWEVEGLPILYIDVDIDILNIFELQ
jgi:hypothetical protein